MQIQISFRSHKFDDKHIQPMGVHEEVYHVWTPLRKFENGGVSECYTGSAVYPGDYFLTHPISQGSTRDGHLQYNLYKWIRVSFHYTMQLGYNGFWHLVYVVMLWKLLS